MVVLARRGPVQSVMYLWLRLRWGVTGSHLTGQTRTMNRLASGQTEEAGTGTAQGSAAYHSCSAGRLLVVVAAYPDLAKEVVSEAATGLGVGWSPLVQEQEHRLGTFACGFVYEG